MTIVFLLIFGLAMGSFVNALVWRIREQTKGKKTKEYSITKGRSMCPNCKHELATKDLIPVLSWIFLRGKCRYCQKAISWQYPTVELLVPILFIVSYIFWPADLVGWEWLQFVVWLISLVGLTALAVYDLRYMLLPNKIIFPLMCLAGFAVVAESIYTGSFLPIETGLWGAVIGGGLFFVLFQLSGGSWIGGGDVKLGFLLGLLIGGPELAIAMLFFASALGTLVSLPFILSRRISPKTRIPFGPFLIIGAIIAQLFGEQLIDLYSSTFL